MTDNPTPGELTPASSSPETPKGTPPVHYAGFWIRFIAEMIDTTVLTVAAWILEMGLLWILYGIRAEMQRRAGEVVPTFNDAFNSFFLQMFNLGVYVCLAFPYYVWGHFRYGTTLGKIPFRIFVVDHRTNGAISLRQSIYRCIGYVVSYAILMTGYLMAAFHPEKRALHDLMAGTASVILKKKSSQSEMTEELPPEPAPTQVF
ncbi:MAG: RDD family protein [Methylotenera sp.]|nr:RDD family protein [Oligoflexia bacterium]